MTLKEILAERKRATQKVSADTEIIIVATEQESNVPPCVLSEIPSYSVYDGCEDF